MGNGGANAPGMAHGGGKGRGMGNGGANAPGMAHGPGKSPGMAHGPGKSPGVAYGAGKGGTHGHASRGNPGHDALSMRSSHSQNTLQKGETHEGRSFSSQSHSEASLAQNHTVYAISGNNPRDGEYWCSIWEARRTIMSYWEGIKHTFMYEASAQSGGQSFLSYYQEPRQAVFTHARLSAELPATLVPSTLAPTGTSTDPKFQAANFKGLTFLAGNASAPTETVGAVWYRGASP